MELAKQLDVDPRACIGSFFERIQVADAEYRKHFDDEVASFKDRIKKRAEQKVQDAVAEQEEEDRQARLGPGGLDPVEVFDSLPEVSLVGDHHVNIGDWIASFAHFTSKYLEFWVQTKKYWKNSDFRPFQELQQCFESRNIALLQESIGKMPEEEAKYHMKRCVESGLWVPEGGKAAAAGDDDEPEYSEVGDAKPTSSTASKTSSSTDDVD